MHSISTLRHSSRGRARAIACAIVLGGVAPTPTAFAAESAVQVAQAGALSAPDRSLMNLAAGAGLYEVEVSKLAASKAVSAEVKDYALMLAKHHGESNEALRRLAARKSVPLVAEIPADKKARIEALQGLSGEGFDRAYVDRVGIQDHEADIRLFENMARDANDADLRAFAERTLPALKEHLNAAKTMAGNRRQAPASQ
jgi:putative membrane protein